MASYNESAFHLLSLKDRNFLSFEEEISLIERVQKYNDEEALDILIYKNLGIIEMIANRFINRGFEIDDLVQEGATAFIKAVKTFDINKKYKLSTYAITIMKRDIIRALSVGSRNVRYPDQAYYDMGKLKQIYYLLYAEHEEHPTLMQLAEYSGLDIKNVEFLLRFANDTESLMEELEDETLRMYTVVSDEFISPEDYTLYSALKNDINKMFETLDFNVIKKIILNYYYGLNGFIKKDFSEIAKILCLSISEVKRFHKAAINEIRFSKEAIKLAAYTNNPEESIKEIYVYRTRGKIRKRNKN